MKTFLFLIIVTLCFSSCERKHVYYFYDEISNDTIVSLNFLNKKPKEKINTVYPKVVIVLQDSVYEKKEIIALLSRIHFMYLLKIETNLNLCDFFLYKKKSSFSNFSLYSDSNYYLKGHAIFLADGNPSIPLLFENFYLRDKILKEEQRKREFKDSIKRDSAMIEFGKQKMKLAFMGYKLGSSYAKYSEFITQIKYDKKILNENIDEIKIHSQNDIIYEIDVILRNKEKGFYAYQVSAILDLYREMYGENYGGYEWVFQDSKIIIETKSKEFEEKEFEGYLESIPLRDSYEIKDGLIRKIAKRKRNKIYEIAIKYYDDDAFTISNKGN